MDKKDSNPKQAYGDMKVGVSTVPMAFLYGVAMAMTEGGMKYGRHNYRKIGCKHSTYFDAAMGHLVSWWEGEDIDEESGVHHLLKAAASIAVVYDSIVMKNDNDDRPIRYPAGVPLRNNDAITKLKEKLPNPMAPFTEKEHGTKAADFKTTDDWVGDVLADGLSTFIRLNEDFGLKPGANDLFGKRLVEAVSPIEKGELVQYDSIFRSQQGGVPSEGSPKKSDVPTDEEIDRVLDYMFEKADEPDFIIVERKGKGKLTPEIRRLIEQALDGNIQPTPMPYTTGTPGYGGKVGAPDLWWMSKKDKPSDFLKEVDAPIGYRPICDECVAQEICRKELTCGNCVFYIPTGRSCLKGKLLLHTPTEDTSALGCEFFERETE